MAIDPKDLEADIRRLERQKESLETAVQEKRVEEEKEKTLEKNKELQEAILKVRENELQIAEKQLELAEIKGNISSEELEKAKQILKAAEDASKNQQKIVEKKEKELEQSDELLRKYGIILQKDKERIGFLEKAKIIMERMNEVTAKQALDILGQRLQEISTKVIAKQSEFDEAAAGLRKLTNTSGEYNDMLMSIAENNRALGFSYVDVSNSISGLQQNFIGFNTISKDSQEELAKFTTAMDKAGIEIAATTTLLNVATKSFGMSITRVRQYQQDLFAFAKANNISTKTINDGLTSVMPRLSAFGREGPKIFNELAFAAKKTGIEMGKLLDITEQFTTFEGAAEAAGTLNAVLGANYIDTLKLLKAANEDPLAAMDMLRNALNATGRSFDQLSGPMKRTFADIMKMDVDTAARFFNMTSEEAKKAAMNTKQFEDAIKTFIPVGDKLKNLFVALSTALGPVIKVVGIVIDGLTWLAESTVGRVIITIVGALAVLVGGFTALFGIAMTIITTMSLVFKVFTGLQTLIPGVGTVVSGLGNTVSATMTRMFGSIGRGFSAMMRTIASGFVAFGRSVAGLAAPQVAAGVGVAVLISLTVLALAVAVYIVVQAFKDLFKILIDSNRNLSETAIGFIAVSIAIGVLGAALATLGGFGSLAGIGLAILVGTLAALAASAYYIGEGMSKAKAGFDSFNSITVDDLKSKTTALSAMADQMQRLAQAAENFSFSLSIPEVISYFAKLEAQPIPVTTAAPNDMTPLSAPKAINAYSNLPPVLLKNDITIQIDKKVLATYIREEVRNMSEQPAGATESSLVTPNTQNPLPRR